MRSLSVSSVLIAAALLGACGKASNTAPPLDAPAAAEPVAATPPSDAAKKALLATLPAAYQNADLDNGQAKVALCKSCHSLEKGGGAMVGPGLYGVFGRKAAADATFAYSDGLKALGVVWDADKLNQWISKPSAMVAGTKMSYAGMDNPKDRIDLIAYLKVATTAP